MYALDKMNHLSQIKELLDLQYYISRVRK